MLLEVVKTQRLGMREHTYIGRIYIVNVMPPRRFIRWRQTAE